MAQRRFHCDGCGANVEFQPGAEHLQCPYCGTEKAIPSSEAEVEEHDLEAAFARGLGDAPRLEARTARCGACGASTRLPEGTTASRCAFCDAPMVTPPRAESVLAPQALLPFSVDAKAAKEGFQAWLKSRWFAPSDLARRARREGLDGVYLPFFTFDAATETLYRGERGEHYYETERYIEEEDGRRVERTRTVQRTRWYPARGTVWLTFDDVLVLASKGLPEPMVEKLEPWDLEALVPYREDYLSGFSAECDQRGLADAFERGKARCADRIEDEVRRDIGGDEQRIHRHRTAWTNLSYKHVLLPAWVGAFRYGDRVYRVVVNARTGEVQGERPWSPWKIGLAVAAAAIALGAVVWLASAAG